MKDQIIALRNEGKSYREIEQILGCSRGSISYHCGAGQKEKFNNRQKELRKGNTLLRKVDNFLRPGTDKRERRKEAVKSSVDKQIYDKRREFNRRGPTRDTFTYQDVMEKFGDKPMCYLTGRPIDWNDPRSFSFDHKIPSSKGGSNSLDNLGIVCREANVSKSDMLVDDYVKLCIEVLRHNGYEVTAKQI